MIVCCILLILIYCDAQMDSRDLEIMNSGLMKLNRNDMIVVFFVTIRHHGELARNVIATMVECCEKVTDDDIDCDLIKVYGIYLGMLQPGTTHNITFLYPNIYGYNRRGNCVVDIWNKVEGGAAEDANEIRHKIDFDTRIRLPAEEVPACMQGFYNPDKVLRCETTDLDPFDACNPVDCRLKYSGYRNYFNHKRKRCQRVPTCRGDPNKDYPDIAYVPTSNTCTNLEKSITEEDIQILATHKYDTNVEMDPTMANIQCHHGEIDVRSGLCVCDKGYTSEPFNPETYKDGISVYHMCDKKCHPDEPERDGKKLVPVIFGIVLAFWIIFIVLLCENCNYLCQFFKKFDEEEDEVCYFPVEGQEE